ncbi:MAG: mechanosensitive ion channel family protein, partial [Cryobacterium sp.]|nr:mechanosensitive ion channel family protein [Cryobacterium sp.]
MPDLEGFIQTDYLIAFLAAVVGAVVTTAVVAFIFRMVGRKEAWARTLVGLVRVPFRLTLLVGAIWSVNTLFLQSSDEVERLVDFIFRALFIATATWLVSALLFFVEEITAARYRIDVRDNRVARRVRTQLRMLRRIGVVVIVICAIGAVLLSIPGAATLGASLFASAGLLSVVAGLAAQSTLANVLAGIKLAINSALRVD